MNGRGTMVWMAAGAPGNEAGDGGHGTVSGAGGRQEDAQATGRPLGA